MKKNVTRREALKGAALLGACGITISAEEVAGQAVKTGAAGSNEVSTRILALHFRVPKNIEIRTEIERTNVTLPLQPMEQLKKRPNFTPVSRARMDLTTAKTAQWLNLQSAGSTSVHCTCCVRG